MPKVSALGAATLPLVGTETLYVVQGGNSRKSDVDAILALVPAKLNASGAAPMFACRAWVNFNGTGVVAIRASGNVSSITDNGVGDYTVNFTTAMPDANYAAVFSYTNEVNVQHAVGFITSQLAGSVRIVHHSATNSPNTADKAIVNVAIFR